ncbi:MAG: acetyl-CoA carboxylase carboxyltransferase subunit beta [Deltaproteobacteria bacterium]|nr:acetyl-CoA carboxylase carboxyltransferase subunit beta [Deltaproteobacteria bacterium]
MSWFSKFKKDIGTKGTDKSVKVPQGLWMKCNNCGEIVYKKEIERNLDVCPKCNYHFRINIKSRIDSIIDSGTFKDLDADLESIDFLEFKDTKRYKDRLRDAWKIRDTKDAVISGEGCIEGNRVMVAFFDFSFMGGSMGSVVGEKVTRTFERALGERCPALVFSSSGGARMQEGIMSLMQMAKTSAAIQRLKEAGIPYISVLTDPTTGGVTASFSMLGDIIIAEPKALVGFAGPRVIEQTIRQKLPEGFQRSEFLLEHGMVDMIVDRKNMKTTLANLISMMYG